MAKLVSKIYGDALFDLSLEQQKLDAMTEEVEGVQKVLSENPELMQVLVNPDIGKTEKLDFAERVFKGRVSDDMVGFLRVVITKERSGELNHIFEYFIEREKEHNRIGVALVTSPKELSDQWKARIERKILDTTNYIKMEMSYETDPTIIGGLIIRIGDTVVDNSVRSKLADISYQLTNMSLEAQGQTQGC